MGHPLRAFLHGRVTAIDNKALLLRLRDPRKVTEVIPKSKELSGNRVVVNWGVDEAHVLKNLNIVMPSPIEGKYKWTGKYKPFEHQKTTAGSRHLTNVRSLQRTSTGKTASAIWAADFLMKQGRIKTCSGHLPSIYYGFGLAKIQLRHAPQGRYSARFSEEENRCDRKRCGVRDNKL